MATDLLTFPRTSDEVAKIAGDSVRSPTLQRGENYVQRLWGKKITFSVVQFIGIGTAVDALLEKAPRIKDLTTDQRYFFNFVNDAGEIETVGLGMNENVLVRGDAKERVTFLKVLGETYPAPAPVVKPAAAPAPAAEGETPAEPKKRGRKPGKKADAAATVPAAAEAPATVEEALVPLADDVTDATVVDPAEAPQPDVEAPVAETHEGDDRVAA